MIVDFTNITVKIVMTAFSINYFYSESIDRACINVLSPVYCHITGGYTIHSVVNLERGIERARHGTNNP